MALNEMRLRARSGYLAVLIVMAAVGLSQYVGMRQFGGYDLSPLVDVLYRLDRGENPGVDFINTLPLTFLAYLKFLVGVFGPSWRTLIYGGSLAFGLCAGFVYFLSKPFMGWQLRLLAVMVLAIPLIVTNHVWHNVLTSYLAIVFLVLCLRALNAETRSAPAIDCLMVGLFAGLVFFSKQNVGLPLILMTAALCAYRHLFLQDRAARMTLIAMTVGVVVFGALLFVLFTPDITLMSYPFTAVRGRIVPDAAMFRATMDNPPFLLIELAAIAILISLIKDHRSLETRNPAFVLCFGFAAVGLLAFVTNWDVKYNDLVLIVVPGLITLGISETDRADTAGGVGIHRMIKGYAAAICVLLCAAICLGVTRYRTQQVGEFFEDAPMTMVTSGFFSGLYAGPRMQDALRQLSDYVADHPDARRSLFCGPRIEFCYAEIGASSPKGFPLWWHPGSSYAVRDTGRIMRLFQAERFAHLVFLDGDRTRMPQEILEYMAACYRRQPGHGVLEFYRRTCG